jgi:hypothetical protein
VSWDADLRPRGQLRNVEAGDPRRVIRGSPVPVIELLSEDEALHDWATQRPDSDVPGDLFRCYAIPGRGHESGLLNDLSWSDDRMAAGVPGAAVRPMRRHHPTAHLLAAVLEHLVAWAGGTAAPRVDPLPVIVPAGFRHDPEGVDFAGVRILHDADGHALGGLRYLDIELPVARAAPRPDGPSTMREWAEEPFAEEELVRRYGSREGLRACAGRVAERLVAQGFLLAADVAEAVDDLCRRWPGS